MILSGIILILEKSLMIYSGYKRVFRKKTRLVPKSRFDQTRNMDKSVSMKKYFYCGLLKNLYQSFCLSRYSFLGHTFFFLKHTFSVLILSAFLLTLCYSVFWCMNYLLVFIILITSIDFNATFFLPASLLSLFSQFPVPSFSPFPEFMVRAQHTSPPLNISKVT